jgi:hypothetical protein
MVNNIASHNNMDNSSVFDRGVVHIVVAGYMFDHYCLMFDRGAVHIVVAGYILDQ